MCWLNRGTNWSNVYICWHMSFLNDQVLPHVQAYDTFSISIEYAVRKRDDHKPTCTLWLGGEKRLKWILPQLCIWVRPSSGESLWPFSSAYFLRFSFFSHRDHQAQCNARTSQAHIHFMSNSITLLKTSGETNTASSSTCFFYLLNVLIQPSQNRLIFFQKHVDPCVIQFGSAGLQWTEIKGCVHIDNHLHLTGQDTWRCVSSVYCTSRFN